MSQTLQFSAPTPLGYFASLVAEDETLSLLEAAASLGQDECDELDIEAVVDEVEQLAGKLRRRIPGDAVPLMRLRFLNRFFYQELGFSGNVNHFYDPANSYLHHVLKERRGIPVTLAILYIELANAVGLRARGIAFPGHFLIKLRMPAISNHDREGEVIIDPVSGHSLSREELEELLSPYRRSQGLEGDFDIPLGLFLQTASPREVLARLLKNLKAIHQQTGDWQRALQVCHRLVVLLPGSAAELRDRGAVEAEMGLTSLAMQDIQEYLRAVPDAADRMDWELQLARWKSNQAGASGAGS